MKRFMTVLLIILLPIVLFGQKDLSSPYKNQIGAAAGFTTGYGISYRYWPDKWGVQLTTTPYFEKGRANSSFGVTVLMRLQEMSWVNLYLYLGNHLIFDRTTYYPQLTDAGGNLLYDTYGNPVYSSQLEYANNYRWLTGIGPGFEFIIGKRFSFNLMFGFRSDYATNEDYKIAFTGETGIYFRF